MKIHRAILVLVLCASCLPLTACKTTGDGETAKSGEQTGASETGNWHRFRYRLDVEDEDVDLDEATTQVVETAKRRLEASGIDANEMRVASPEPGIIDIEVAIRNEQQLERVRASLGPGPGLHVHLFDREAATALASSIAPDADVWVGQDGQGNPVVGHAERGELEEAVAEAKPEGVAVAYAKGGATALEDAEKRDDWMAYALKDEPVVGAGDVANARAVGVPEPAGAPPYYVMVELTDPAAARFEDFTEKHVGEKLAIVIEDRVSLLAVIQEAIGGGRLQITVAAYGPDGERLSDEAIEQRARDLVAMIRAGSLPSPLIKVSEGPVED